MPFDADDAARLRALRDAARSLYAAGQTHEAVHACLVAADFARALRIPIEANALLTTARRLIVLMHANMRWGSGLIIDDVVPLRARGDPLGLRATRRFWIDGPWLSPTVKLEPVDPVIAAIDPADRVRFRRPAKVR